MVMALAGAIVVLTAMLLWARRTIHRQQVDLAYAEALGQEARRQVRSTLENMGDAFYLVGGDERFAYMNPMARRLFSSQGLDPDTLIGKRIWDEFPELRGTFAEDELRRALRERVTAAFDFYYPPWQRWFAIRLFPSNDGGIAVHLTDTTDLRALQDNLRESAQQLTLAVEAANLTAFEWDISSGRVRRLGEVPSDAPLGAEYSFDELVATIHPEDQASMLGRLEATLRGDTDLWISEHRSNENPQREWCWHRVRGRLIRSAQGTPVSMIGMSMDISEHKRLEEALRDADRRKDDFLATLAHELRNPLAPIRYALHLLKAQAPKQPELVQSRDVIERQVAQMARLLDDLLDVSRIARGTLELRQEETDVREVVARALETSAPLIAERRHEVRVELEPGEPLPLKADLMRLAQVFGNLLNNAAKYTEDGGIITIAAARTGDEVTISVRDTGIGLAPADLEAVFSMFTQAAPATLRSRDGLGIGLSLARSIVALHGGTLEALSEGPGRGSEFRARLPLDQRPDVMQHRPAAPEVDGTEQHRWRLVIADDLRDITDSLAELLRLKGHEVVTAYDGIEAVECVESYRPEAVLLDIGMPRLDGYEACQRIRATPFGAELIIVALTGWGQSVDRDRTAEAGFTEHLVKPVDYVELLRVLEVIRTTKGQDA